MSGPGRAPPGLTHVRPRAPAVIVSKVGIFQTGSFATDGQRVPGARKISPRLLFSPVNREITLSHGTTRSNSSRSNFPGRRPRRAPSFCGAVFGRGVVNRLPAWPSIHISITFNKQIPSLRDRLDADRTY